MRFLCLHGIGTNARILQQQTAAIRYDLGPRHTYDFVEGTLAWAPDPNLETMLGDEKTFSYCDPADAASWLKALELLEQYVAAEGPYDGVLGFSLGANIAMLWMIHRQQHRPHEPLPSRVGVFFSNTFGLIDLDALRQGQVRYAEKLSECLDLPTAHVWGAKDGGGEDARVTSQVYKAGTRSTYVHGKAHEISTAGEDVMGMVKAINRAIGEAEGRC
ncbi:serine hydrolase FSH [Aspergillus aurantiobrunneus]